MVSRLRFRHLLPFAPPAPVVVALFLMMSVGGVFQSHSSCLIRGIASRIVDAVLREFELRSVDCDKFRDRFVAGFFEV